MSLQPSLDTDESTERPKVLLVDDDDLALMLTAEALRGRGFEITEASSGEQALAMLSDWTPDIIVLDAVMPGLDGFDTCHELRESPGFENMPVLMLTGLDDEVSINRAYQVGATDFFVKSTQWSLLAGRLRHVLRSARTRQELERSKSKLARAQDLARMGSFDWRKPSGSGHPTGGLTLAPEALRVFGYGSQERVSMRRLVRMVPLPERRGMTRVLAEVQAQNTVLAIDVPVTLPNGSMRIVHVEAEPEFNEHGQGIGYTGIVQDVTDRRVAEDRIRHLANFDALTGLPNRRQLIWRTERALDHARRMGHLAALLLIDLDRFKLINDTLGHASGDELLVEVARRLRGCVRHSDQVMDSALESAGARSHRTLEAVGRLGGDEFVALLPEVADEDDAERVSRRILDAMREPIFVGGQECFVTASVGVALYPRDGQSVADLLRNSDVAMYSVKDAGRNASAIYSPMLAGRGRARSWNWNRRCTRPSSATNWCCTTSPRWTCARPSMVGVEALMRWRRGDTLVLARATSSRWPKRPG